MSFLFTDANVLYSAALGLIVIIFIVEALGLLFGLSLLSLIDDLSPVDMDADVSAGGTSALLSWLCLDRLPLMIWLIIWLSCFAACGFTLTSVVTGWLPFELPFWLHLLVALIVATLATAQFGGVIARIIPRQQSSAIDTESLAGYSARITMGTARPGSPAEARVEDKYHQVHYVMVEPIDTESFAQGDTVILVKKGPHGWLVMRYR